MGNWQLEIMKMALYMSFPVGLFHYFNQPQYFEDWVTRTKREIYPPDDKATQKMVQDAIKGIKEQQEIKMLQALEENANKM